MTERQEVSKMREVVIVAGVRTAVGVFGGGFKNYSVVDLGATVI
jgi:acetyl-CoA acetyltransferase